MKIKDACLVVWLQCVGACIFSCRTAAISVPFTPLSTFRFQPLPAVAFLAIDVDITFHYITSQFSAFGRLGVARRPWRFLALSMLADLDAHKSHRCSQVSQVLAATCSH